MDEALVILSCAEVILLPPQASNLVPKQGQAIFLHNRRRSQHVTKKPCDQTGLATHHFDLRSSYKSMSIQRPFVSLG